MVQTRGATPQAKPGQKHISYGRIRSSLRVGSPSRFTGIAKGQAVSAQPGFRALLLRDATPRLRARPRSVVQNISLASRRPIRHCRRAGQLHRSSRELQAHHRRRRCVGRAPSSRMSLMDPQRRKRVRVDDSRASQRISAPPISKSASLPSPLKGTRYTFNLMAPRGGEPRTAMASLQGARFRTGRLPRRSSAARSLPRLSRQGRSSARTPATAARLWKD
jgi:hypothetical protein